jgi:hypothetical protein
MRHISVIPSALGPKDKDGKITQKGKREGCESFRFYSCYRKEEDEDEEERIKKGRDLPSWMKIIFINVSSKCFLHETVHTIWVPSALGAKARMERRAER